jgi:hypothetical protein
MLSQAAKDAPYRAFRSFPIASAPMKWRRIRSTTGTTRSQHRAAADLPAIQFTPPFSKRLKSSEETTLIPFWKFPGLDDRSGIAFSSF